MLTEYELEMLRMMEDEPDGERGDQLPADAEAGAISRQQGE